MADVSIIEPSSLTDDVTRLVYADVLVISLSSLSYAAAMLRDDLAADGVVVAPACMADLTIMLPLPRWELAPCCPNTSNSSDEHDRQAPPQAQQRHARRLSRRTRAPPRPPPLGFC